MIQECNWFRNQKKMFKSQKRNTILHSNYWLFLSVDCMRHMYLSIWNWYKPLITGTEQNVGCTFNIEWIDDVMVDELEVLVSQPVLHVPLPACEEVVCHGHFMSLHHQLVHKMRAHESSATCDLTTNAILLLNLS